MAKKSKGINRSNRSTLQSRALNAFDYAEEENDKQINLSEDSDDEKPNYTSNIVKEEDDEEIDSDEAMGSEEEDDDFTMSRKNVTDYSDNGSDSESVASIDESELLPLSAVWDLDDEIKNDSSVENDSQSNDESNNSEDSEEEFSVDEDADEEIDSDQLSKLREMISSNSENKPSNKVRKLETNNLPESEFSLAASGEKISLTDLTGGVNKDSLTLLKDKKGKEYTPKALDIPLARRIQQRHDRKAAYEFASDEVTKWEDTVKSIREADHLQFPINPKAPVSRPTATTISEPSTELEKKVNNILKESGLSNEKTLSTFEELASSKMSIEEVKKRRNELRLMRELMFREEKRAKRIKKIKSKSYRKVHKKERQRLQDMVEEEEGDEDDKLELDINRAKERMSLKHKNNSKWAKRMVNQGFTKDIETRAEMEEMLRRGDSLRQKIMGQTASDKESDGSDNDQNEFVSEEENGDQNKVPNVGKGLLNMKFMRDAQAREKKMNDQLEQDDYQYEDQVITSSTKAVINEGRRVFAPGAKEAEDEANEATSKVLREEEEDDEENDDRGSKFRKKQPMNEENETIELIKIGRENSGSNKKPKTQTNYEHKGQFENESNPWFSENDSNGQKRGKSSVSVIGQDSSVSLKNQEKIRKQKKSDNKESDQDALIDMNQTLDIVDQFSEDTTHGKTIFNQQDLVKRAFAGDDVVDEFQKEKKQRIEMEGDQEIDVSLPGWGSWAGNGVKRRTKLIKKVKGVKADKRKDSKLRNVIINEKINRKANRYTASAVPFPFENRQQYEQSLRMPIGQEWSTRDTHQKLTKPKILVQQGAVIDPINAPFK